MKKHILSIFAFLLVAQVAFAESMPANFYNSVNGLQDSIFKGTLKTLIREHTVIPYGNGSNSTWNVFYYSDQDENGYCMDMYCDTWQKFTSPGAVVSGCNIEHSLANSWWGGVEERSI